MSHNTRKETIELYRAAAGGDALARRELHKRQRHLSDAAIDNVIEAVKRGPERADRVPFPLNMRRS